MSPLIAEEAPAQQYQWAAAAEIYRQQTAPPPDAAIGPQPWCRVCQRGVMRWAWDRYAGGFLGLCACCHGEVCGGLLPLRVCPWDARVEAFCDDEPRLREFPLWFVGFGGEELQAPQAYLDAAVESGRAHPVLGGSFGGWVRANAGLIGAGLIPVTGLPALVKLVAWLLLLWQ